MVGCGMTMRQRETLTNLPAQRIVLIGRDQDRAAVHDLVLHSHGRLVTLTGPGGCGKTSLALDVASQLLDAFSDGVVFVDLALLSDPALVYEAVASALGVRHIP